MFKRLIYCDSISWVHLQAGFHETECVFLNFSQIFYVKCFVSDYLRKLDVLEFYISAEILLLIRCQPSDQFVDQVDLVDFVVSWKHGLAIDKLANHATNSPQVCRLPIGLAN